MGSLTVRPVAVPAIIRNDFSVPVLVAMAVDAPAMNLVTLIVPEFRVRAVQVPRNRLTLKPPVLAARTVQTPVARLVTKMVPVLTARTVQMPKTVLTTVIVVLATGEITVHGPANRRVTRMVPVLTD
jgi:hypothetical protein